MCAACIYTKVNGIRKALATRAQRVQNRWMKSLMKRMIGFNKMTKGGGIRSAFSMRFLCYLSVASGAWTLDVDVGVAVRTRRWGLLKRLSFHISFSCSFST